MTFMERLIGVFKLDKSVFENVEHDESALSQAAVVITAIAILSTIGTLINNLVFSDNAQGFMALVSSFLMAYIGWGLWSAAVWIVGTKMFGGQADLPEMLRVIGFAYAPMLLQIIPCIGIVAGLLWTLAAGFVAVREGLDLDNTKAFLTIVVGFFVYLIGAAVVGMIFGVGSVFGSLLGA